MTEIHWSWLWFMWGNSTRFVSVILFGHVVTYGVDYRYTHWQWWVRRLA